MHQQLVLSSEGTSPLCRVAVVLTVLVEREEQVVSK